MNVIKTIKITDIVPNKGQVDGLPKNPRFIKDYRFEALKKSISDAPEMLSLRELIVFPFNGKYVTLCGNMRLRACKELGFKEVPCKVLDERTPADKLREYTIKDNNAFGDTDFDLLANEWDTDELGDWGVEFPSAEIDDLGDAGEPDEVEEVEIPENVETRCKKGDIWQLGNHRLACGDSTDAGTIALLMGDEKADLVFTDPPYNVAIGDKNKALNAFIGSKSIERNLEGDAFKSDEEAGQKLWLPAFKNLYDSANDKCAIYVTMPQGGTHMMMMMMMSEAGWQVKHELIWVKNAPTFSMGRLDYDYQHEPISFGWKKGHKKIGKGKFTKSVWNIDKPRKDGEHPTMKPIELIVNAMQNSSEKNDLVIVFFGGSGSTLIAAEEIGRKCYMCELDPHYCDVIIARWEKYTGKTAIKVEEHNE
jgi:DNA modification methylase